MDTTLPLQASGGHWVAELSVNGQASHFIVDTGASHMAVTERFAQAMNLPKQRPQVLGVGASESYLSQPTVLAHMTAGTVVVKDMQAFIIPTPEEFTPDGVVGNSFLQQFVVTLNPDEQTLRLQSPDQFLPPTENVALPITRLGQLILVPAAVAGHLGDCQVDTGAGNHVTVLHPAADRLNLRGQFSPQLRTLTGRSAGGDTWGDMVRLPELSVGGFSFNHVIAELSLAEDGFFARTEPLCNLGNGIWQRFIMTIDYPHDRLYLTPGLQIQTPFVYSRAGISLGRKNGALETLHVIPGGPSDQAGLRPGDLIERVNGQAASTLGNESLRAAMLAPVGSVLRLSVRNPGQVPREHQVELKDLL